MHFLSLGSLSNVEATVFGRCERYILFFSRYLFAAYYIIFLSFDNPNTPEGVDDSVSNPMPSPMESVMAMFLMSMTNFGDYYGAFERTEHEFESKVFFLFTCRYEPPLSCQSHNERSCGRSPIIVIAAAVCVVHGNRGDSARKHANCYDGQHLPEDCRDQK